MQVAAISYSTPRPTAQAHKAASGEDDRMRYAGAVLLLSMAQMVLDLVTEMRNLPEMRGRFRWEFAMVSHNLTQLHRRVRRVLPKDVADRFESMLCDIADEMEPHMDRVRLSLKEQMINKISWDKIGVAILTGMIGCLLDCMKKVNEAIAGKSRYEFDVCHAQMKIIEDNISFEQMNAGVEPDFGPCRKEMEAMYRTMNDLIIQKVKSTKI